MRNNVYVNQGHIRHESQLSGGDVARDRYAAQSPVDGVRSGRVRRLPRGDRAARVSARPARRRSGSGSEAAGFIRADVLDWIKRGAPTRIFVNNIEESMNVRRIR